MKYLLSTSLIVLCGLALVACKEEAAEATFAPSRTAYLPLLESPQEDPLSENNSLIVFWSARMTPDSTGVGELAPLGSAYEERFQLSGAVNDLHKAMRLYQLGVIHSAHHKDQFVRHQARVAISLHQFDLGYRLLDSLIANGGQNRQTRLQLFDAAMEVGKFKVADSLLTALEDDHDFNYLLRAAKWNDHRGDLDTAIIYMEKAMKLAEAKDSPPLLQWVYSNLATFYGHAGRLEASYGLLQKTLSLNPRHVQSLKQLCWMQYSAARDIPAANELVEYIATAYQGLEILLLKADLLEFQGDLPSAAGLRKDFVSQVEERGLTQLYANHLIELWSERNPDALILAQKQFDMRPTATQAALLAYCKQLSGDRAGAKELATTWDLQHAHEPMARYYGMKTLHGLGEPMDKSALLELQEASFELGPIRAAEVKQW